VAKKLIADKPQKVKSNFVPSEQRRAEYKRTYDRLMERAKGRVKVKGVHDNHHIVPKSLGGSNEKSNIVALTYREHFLAHWLLTKFTEGKARISMLKALSEMRRAGKNHKNRVISGWQYDTARRAMAEAVSLWHKTPKGEESHRKVGESLLKFFSTPQGQETLIKRNKKAGETRRVFNATPEGQESLRKAGKKRGETMRARGSLAGENHPNAKVTEEIVRQIRAFEGSHVEAARHFGVTRRSAYAIRTRRTWRHIK
jgi:hypothetical protein